MKKVDSVLFTIILFVLGTMSASAQTVNAQINSAESRAAMQSSAGITPTLSLAPSACTLTYTKTPYDFDGDCIADPSVWKPAESSFEIRLSAQNITVSGQLAGHNRDRIIPADYDGDGKTDYAVFIQATRVWYVLKSSNQQIFTYSFGAMGDVPVPGDFDGDGKADVAVWRPSTGFWYISESSTQNANWYGVQFGARGDIPVVGDYDNDGKSDVAVWRPSDGTWYVQQSTNGFTGLQWGQIGDVPVPADYDGDKKTDYAVWRASTGEWFISKSASGTLGYLPWGSSSFHDVPVAADYDGDGKADIAVWRPSDGIWYISKSSDSSLYGVQLGAATNTPVPTGGKCDASKRICRENSYNLNYISNPFEWQVASDTNGAYEHEIEGYASQTSVNVGEPISFHVNVSTSGSYKIEIYRMGWYNGAGASLQNSTTVSQGQSHTFPEADHTTGLLEYNWTPDYTWTPPSGTVSGFFIAKLTKLNNGKQSYIIFVVRDDARVSDFLLQSTVTTYQAYNNYPGAVGVSGWQLGRSLYAFNSYGPVLPGIPPGQTQQDTQAREVSFNRPYFPETNPGLPEPGAIYRSAGQFFRWEYNMVRWMEKEDYDVTYQTDIDTDAQPETLAAGKHKTFLSIGHDEYWSWKMRDNVEQARNRSNQPLNLGFFGANNSYWQIRFKDSSATSSPANASRRTIIGYKDHYNDDHPNLPVGDPNFKNTDLTDNYLITTQWRNNKAANITSCPSPQPDCNCPNQIPNCTKYPEDELIGVMTRIDPPINGTFDFVFDSACFSTNSSTCPSWIINGVSSGTTFLPGLVGYEFDSFITGNNYGRNVQILGKSPVSDGSASYDSHAVYYKLDSNQAKVFAIGTTDWVLGVDDFGQNSAYGSAWQPARYNPNAETVTRNVLACFLYGGTTCGS